MRMIRSALAGLLTLLAVHGASAQQFPTVPSNTVIGRSQIGTGPSQAIPFSQLIALMLQSTPLTIPAINTNSIVFKGATSGTATVSAQAVAGTTVLALPTVSGTFLASATAPIVANATTGAVSCPTCLTSSSNLTSVATIAVLKAQPAPSVQTAIYVEGYALARDGGEGWFEYCTTCNAADNGGTIIIPNSAPANGRWNRAREANDGYDVNVKWFGAKGDGATNDNTAVGAARDVAIAQRGGLYFPASVSCYVTALTIVDSTSGLRIHGDAMGYFGSATGSGSCLTSASAAATIDLQSNAGGNTNNIVIENLKVTNTGSGDALKVTNVLWTKFSNLILFGGSAGAGLDIIGTGNFSVNDVQAYGSSSNALKIVPSGSTNSGPGIISAGQFSNQNGTSTSCIIISGMSLGIVFQGSQFSCFGANMVATVLIDGDGVTATQTGEVTFIECHGESNYNTSNTSVDFLIGQTNKFGTVNIIGWSGFGQGNGTNYQRDGVQITRAQNVSVRDSNFSKLAATNGYSRGAIRLEATFPAAGDKYDFKNNNAGNISGTMYSDANARLTGSGDFYSDGVAWTTYTPTLSCGSGTFTSASATGRYKLIGKSILVQVDITVTTNGTCAGSMRASTPITAASNYYAMSVFDKSSGATGSAAISNVDGTTIRIFTVAGAYPTGFNPAVTGVYEIP